MTSSKHFALYAMAAISAAAIIQPAAASEWYGKVSVGQGETEVSGLSFGDDVTYGAALGTSLGPVRIEAGVDRISGGIDLGGPSIEADALVYSTTAYLDLPIGANASLYAGAGIDYVDGEASFFGADIGASGDGYHWSVGGAYRFNDRIIGEAQFSQLTADLDVDYLGGADLENNRFTLGLRLEL